MDDLLIFNFKKQTFFAKKVKRIEMTNEVDDIKQRINNFLEMDDQNDNNIRTSIGNFNQSKKSNLQTLFDVEKAAREEPKPE